MKFSEPKTYDECAEFFRSDIKERLMLIKNTDARFHLGGRIYSEAWETLDDFIIQAFVWDKTPQGEDFWRPIYRSPNDYLECYFEYPLKKEIYEIF